LTISISKQLLPVYDKPMIYYPISLLIEQSIKKIIIISTKQDLPRYKTLLGTGKNFGVKFIYVLQDKPLGLVQAFTITKNYIKGHSVCLVLGDNIFYGPKLQKNISSSLNTANKQNKAFCFSYKVDDPTRFGVIKFNRRGDPVEIEEKPLHPKTNFALVGLYIFPKDVYHIAKKVKFSKRGQLEITDLIQLYLNENRLKVSKLSNDTLWLDTGTHNSLLEASNLIYKIEKNTNRKVGCLDEIAYLNRLITKETLKKNMKSLMNNDYVNYLNKKYFL
jgi:glucose-1-phosphate thymidylyltransferase